MSYSCYLLLNRREMNSLSCPGIGTFPAFAGQKEGRNNPEKTNVPDIGHNSSWPLLYCRTTFRRKIGAV